MWHADKYNILYPFQHGFRKFRSYRVHRRRDSKLGWW
jgi:hypothetical protein